MPQKNWVMGHGKKKAVAAKTTGKTSGDLRQKDQKMEGFSKKIGDLCGKLGIYL